MDESRGGSRIVYPKLLATLTEADLVSQFRLAPEEGVGGNGGAAGPIDGCIVDPAEGISEHRTLPTPRADTGNSPVIHCEATFTGGAHGRFNRPAHDVSAKQCHSNLDKMIGNVVEIERLDVRERRRCRAPRYQG